MRLRQLRRAIEMSQGELAHRVGLTPGFICQIEKGLRQPSIDSARDIAAVFGVPIEEAFSYVEVPA